MAKKHLIHICILYVIIIALLVSTIWLYSLYSMQKEVLKTYQEQYVEEHFDEDGHSINN